MIEKSKSVAPRTYYELMLGELPVADSAGNVSVACPLCSRPAGKAMLSISLNNPSGLFSCHNCGRYGNMLAFHQQYRLIRHGVVITAGEAAKEIAGVFGGSNV